MTSTDTIAAVATAPGTGGIAVIRVSGPRACEIVLPMFSPALPADTAARVAHYGRLADTDDVVLTIFRAPHSYTGEDTVEISCHGSLYVQNALMRCLVDAGCRTAGPGEFTRRAYMNGRMDLSQAEAVADLISARSQAQHRLALSQLHGSVSRRLTELRERMLHITALLELELDFADHEELEFADRSELKTLTAAAVAEIERLRSTFAAGNAISRGIAVAITGAPNVGKSTLLNRLVGDDCAIVSPVAGTTRDTIEREAVIGGVLFRFVDTAGLRPTTDPVELLGQQRTRRAAADARIVIALSTPGCPEVSDIVAADTADLKTEDTDTSINVTASEGRTIIHCLNKADTLADTALGASSVPDVLPISAKTGLNVDKLTDRLRQLALESDLHTDVTITNARHYEALGLALDDLHRVGDGLVNGLPTDLVAEDLRAALDHLADITGGRITPAETLNTIFERFCIGK